jgi:ribosomal protein S18 acetylase RimI-like enzyme
LTHCAEALSQQGMHHWLDVYDKEEVRSNLATKRIYVLEQNECIIGCVALGTEKAAYYAQCWPDAPEADYYITQLAVDPRWQGEGFGQLLMAHCMRFVGEAHLQLDAVDHYPALLDFYKKLGFRIIATGIGLGDKRHLFTKDSG